MNNGHHFLPQFVLYLCFKKICIYYSIVSTKLWLSMVDFWVVHYFAIQIFSVYSTTFWTWIFWIFFYIIWPIFFSLFEQTWNHLKKKQLNSTLKYTMTPCCSRICNTLNAPNCPPTLLWRQYMKVHNILYLFY